MEARPCNLSKLASILNPLSRTQDGKLYVLHENRESQHSRKLLMEIEEGDTTQT